jgi:phosphoglycerate kinase
MKSVRDLELHNRRVLVRVDFNVPMNEALEITDDIRMCRAVPTLAHIREQGGRLIICSHMGRPKGQRVEKYSLAPVADHLATLLGCPVTMAPDCIGGAVEKVVMDSGPGDVVLLENLRFYQQETENDHDFSVSLARLAEVYVNDAFAVSHRTHASVAGVPGEMKEKGAGFLLQKEMDYFHQAMDSPVRPLAAIVGGAKVSSKLGALENMLERVDVMIIGGAMANTFLKSSGVEVGTSLVENDLLETAAHFMQRAGDKGVQLCLPVDVVVAREFSEEAEARVVGIGDIPPDMMILDIGPVTSDLFSGPLGSAKTIVWNGPMGAFEIDQFAGGTMAMCQLVADSDGLTITGGGDSNAAIKKAGVADKISYMSTGGGAFLRLMEGKSLPGVEVLED